MSDILRTVIRISPLSGEVNEMKLSITDEQLIKWDGGNCPDLIQNVFPNLSGPEREFIKTGITPEEWDEAFPEEEEEEEEDPEEQHWRDQATYDERFSGDEE